MCPLMNHRRPPHRATTALLLWMFGSLSSARDFLIMSVTGCLAGLVIGALTVVLLPPWASLVLLVLAVAGLLWLLKVLSDLGWPGLGPWQK
jgi:ammonia channel protein AmtB